MSSTVIETLEKAFSLKVIDKSKTRPLWERVQVQPTLLISLLQKLKGLNYQLQTIAVLDTRGLKNSLGDFRLDYIIQNSVDGGIVILQLDLPDHKTRFPSATGVFPDALIVEDEIEVLFGLYAETRIENQYYRSLNYRKPADHPMRKDYVLSSARGEPRFFTPDAEPDDIYSWLNVRNNGCQPIDFVKIRHNRLVDVAIDPFYTHRGMEKMFEGVPVDMGIEIAENICADNSFSHSLGYCMALEQLCQTPAPERANYVRMVFLESEILSGHLKVVSNVLASIGEQIYSNRLRVAEERLRHWIEYVSGSRWFRSVNLIGGVRRDICDDALERFVLWKNEFHLDIYAVMHILKNDNFCRLLRGLACADGRVSGTFSGVNARASGIMTDFRSSGFLAYSSLDFKPLILHEGDAYARLLLRLEEIKRGIDIMVLSMEKIPAGDIWGGVRDVKAFATGLGCVESPRGRLLYYVYSGENQDIYRCRICGPSFGNLGLLCLGIIGSELQDREVIMAGFDLNMTEVAL